MTARGVALPLALLVLAVIGTLASGLLWAALLEARSGLGAVRLVQARSAAETGAYRAIGQTPRSALLALSAGDSLGFADSLGPAGAYQGVIRALGSGRFAVTSRGTGPGGAGRQVVVILAILGDSTGLAPFPARSWAWSP